MRGNYEVADRRDRQVLAEFLKREGQFLLPMVELVERTELAIDEVIEVVGRATIAITMTKGPSRLVDTLDLDLCYRVRPPM